MAKQPPHTHEECTTPHTKENLISKGLLISYDENGGAHFTLFEQMTLTEEQKEFHWQRFLHQSQESWLESHMPNWRDEYDFEFNPLTAVYPA